MYVHSACVCAARARAAPPVRPGLAVVLWFYARFVDFSRVMDTLLAITVHLVVCVARWQ